LVVNAAPRRNSGERFLALSFGVEGVVLARKDERFRINSNHLTRGLSGVVHASLEARDSNQRCL
jgi:hypothetical protein